MDESARVVRKAIIFNKEDNVATAISKLEDGSVILVEKGRGIVERELRDVIPLGHKFALEPIVKGDDVIKYGEAIGRSTRDIRVGDHVHIHNVESKRLAER